MKKFWIILFLFVGFACKNGDANQIEQDDTKPQDEEPAIDSVPDHTLNASSVDSLETKDGLKITWLKKGEGETLKVGDVALIEYEVRLENGEVVESSQKINRPFPFLIGYQMQTKGWDIALEKMRVGDVAKVFLPSKLARGEKGIKGIIPPNANNYLSITVKEKLKPTRSPNGNKVWIIEESPKHKTAFSDSNTIEFHTMTGTATNPRYFNSFRSNKPFVLRTEDAGVVPGLKEALIGAKKADRMYILVPPENAYGKKGFQNLVSPNESIFYNVYVMNVF